MTVIAAQSCLSPAFVASATGRAGHAVSSGDARARRGGVRRPVSSRLSPALFAAARGAEGSTPAHRLLTVTHVQLAEAHNLDAELEDLEPSVKDCMRAADRAMSAAWPARAAVYAKCAERRWLAAIDRAAVAAPCASEAAL
jgi:hypothetical protein